MTSYIVAVLFLVTSTSWAADQTVPPAKPAMAATGDCRVSEAKPFLRKAMYSGHSNYTQAALSETPVTLTESVNIDKDITLKIEQRGCQDLSIDFTIDMAKGAKNNFALISRATKILSDLHLDPKSPLNVKQLNEIATKVKAASAKAKDSMDLSVCIAGAAPACATEVKVTTTATRAEFHYVAHP